MPDQTTSITVTFDENGKPVWPTVSPIQMTGAGTITLERAPNMDWSFSDFMFYNQGDPSRQTYPPDFGPPTVSADKIQITDSDQTRGRYFYKYQIVKYGTSYWSPDPEIDNNPR